jgi:hypothetical protein
MICISYFKNIRINFKIILWYIFIFIYVFNKNIFLFLFLYFFNLKTIKKKR